MLSIFFVVSSDWFITLCTLIGFEFCLWTVVRQPFELFTLVYEMHLITGLFVFVSEVLPLVEFVLEDGIR